MLRFVADSVEGILELTVDGRVSREEYELVVDAAEQLLTNHARINLLEMVADMGWIEPEAWWRETVAHLTHTHFLDRVAVVSDTGQVGPVARAFAGFFPSQIRVFRQSEVQAARIWLTGSSEPHRTAHFVGGKGITGSSEDAFGEAEI
jgi:hypothetical protein